MDTDHDLFIDELDFGHEDCEICEGVREADACGWAADVVTRLRELSGDPQFRREGWDSYQAQPLRNAAIQTALRFLRAGPSIVPTSAGGLQLEWHVADLDLELEIDAKGRPISVFAHRASDHADLTRASEASE